MMRWVFGALILANVGLLMWASWYRESPGQTIAARPIFHPELMVPLTTTKTPLKSRRVEKVEAPLVASKPLPRCVEIGPFPETAVEATGNWLTGEHIEASRRNEERRIESSYWIYLGPYAKRSEAEHKMRELEKLSVRDLLIMAHPQGGYAVSLGLFARAENAGNRLEELTRKGIEAKQETRYRTGTVSWFDLRLPEPADDALARLRARDWGAAVEVRDASCPADVPASPPATPVVPPSSPAPAEPAPGST